MKWWMPLQNKNNLLVHFMAYVLRNVFICFVYFMMSYLFIKYWTLLDYIVVIYTNKGDDCSWTHPKQLLISKSIVGLGAGWKLLEGTAKMMVRELAFISQTQTYNPCPSFSLSASIYIWNTLSLNLSLSAQLGCNYFVTIIFQFFYYYRVSPVGLPSINGRIRC